MIRTNKTLKLLVTMAIVLFAVLVLNTSNVKASNATEIKAVIPDTINLDIPEIEFEKAKTMIENQVKEIITNSDLDDKDNLNTYVYYSGGFGTMETFHEATVNVETITPKSYITQKKVNIVYNNTNNTNNEDEQYVKNLKFELPGYMEMDLNYLANKNKEDYWSWFNDYITEHFNKQITNNSVKVSVFVGAGETLGLDLITCESGIYLRIFNNDKLYEFRNIGHTFLIPTVTVPSSITDSELESYITNEIKKYYPEYGSYITSIEKGASAEGVNVENIDNIYTIKDKGPGCLIIVKKAKATTVTSTDTTTNIKLETTTNVVPETTKLVAEKVTEGDNYNTVVEALGNDVSKFVMYDISLVDNNVKIQPNGKVKIKLPIPEGYDTSKIVVYRVNTDGTKTQYDYTIENGYIVIETDHFSNYVVAEEGTTEETESTDTNTTTETTSTTRQLDTTPKTGNNDFTSVVASIVSLLSALGIAFVKIF